MVTALWADHPRLTAGSTVRIFEAEGPGVISCLHASMLLSSEANCQEESAARNQDAQDVVIRVLYDGQSEPSIEMPFMDFLADVQCQSDYFKTVYFSKVKWSHNMRLPMPFRKSIVIELENQAAHDLNGYTDVQWEPVDAVPDDCGYLFADYCSGVLQSVEPITLFRYQGAGRIAAHWLQYESEKTRPLGDWICEADQQIFLDGEAEPALNYLGSEDVYGFSWGFHRHDGDGLCATLKSEEIQPAGARIAALRCRTNDAIRFRNSCRWILTYENDPAAIEVLGNSPIPYRHCVYYYRPGPC